MQLYEQYRPATWADVVGQDKALETIDRLRARGLAGRVYWLAGPSGTGKTTIARLIAAEVADEYAIVEIDAADLTMEAVREFERACSTRPIGQRGHHAFIVNEAHRLSDRVVTRLNTLFEAGNVQRTSVWIFTTTTEGADLFDGATDAHAFLSRSVDIPMACRGLAEVFAKRLKEVAEAEGLDGKDISHYIRLIKDRRNNLRAGFQDIEAGKMLD